MKHYYSKLYSDVDITPVDMFLCLRNVDNHCFIFESLEPSSNNNWTFIGFNPTAGYSIKNGKFIITDLVNQSETVVQTDNPNANLAEVVQNNSAEFDPSLPPFCGGLVGYISYDYIKYSEPKLRKKLDANKNDIEKFNDFDLMLFNNILAFDHSTNSLRIILTRDNTPDEQEYTQIFKLISEGKKAIMPKLELKSDARENFSKDEFEDMVIQAKKYIKEGDIFQVVLSNRIDYDAEGSLFDVYQQLRISNPSPYMFYMSSNDLEIAGAAPETLVSVHLGENDEQIATTFPLAGSRPRGKTDAEDLAFEEDLLSDQKERSEHNMLVDLGRNDIGKIAKFGTVNVEEYMRIHRFSHIMHIGSKVTGVLDSKRASNGVIDVLSAVLPAGTLSGAPKIRACEIIDELEKSKRGIYGGSIGYIGTNGQMDMCIAIRTAYMRGGKVFARSGAGIVYDSDPETEYIEVGNKMRAVTNAIEKVGR